MTAPRLILLTTLFLLSSSAGAQESTDVAGARKPETAGEVAPSPEFIVSHEAIRPCIQSGYVSYEYPAVGSCHCGDDGCFHPHRYYCCSSDAYKKGWMRKWIGTQLGKRSMLDDYLCECICPTTVPRPYLRTVRTNVLPAAVEPPKMPAATE
ncbi:MAG: hypothetical protein Fues2KO_17180 [Fuerstiella sp.]